MSTAPKTKRAGQLRHTPVLTATVAVASIVLLLQPASAAGLRSTSDGHAASRQTRTSAPAHTKPPRAAGGHYLPDSLGNATITYTPYLTPGTHWIAAELSNSDPTSLRPPVWPETVVLHVPRAIRCWPTRWRGTPGHGTPTSPVSRCSTKAGRADSAERFERIRAVRRDAEATGVRGVPTLRTAEGETHSRSQGARRRQPLNAVRERSDPR
jgi:hypothetical protein